MAEETIRKNITLPGIYAKLYKDLERRGEIKRQFGDFSKFVQSMIEQLHDNPERLKAEMHREKAKHHEEMADKLEDELETKKEAEKVSQDDSEWIEDKLDFLMKKSREDGSLHAAFEKRKQDLVTAYGREFASINPVSLKRKLQETAEEKGYDVELATA